MAYFSFDQMGLNVARGLVKDLSGIHKFGFSDTINASWDTVSVGPVHFPVAPDFVSVVSDDDTDQPTAAGAWTMQIEGLDPSGLPQEEIITLDGTTAVTSANQYFRVHRMIVLTSNTVAGAAGTIIASIDGNEVSRIDPEYDNQTLQAVYTIPAGKTGYITSMTISAAKDNHPVTAGLFVKSSLHNNAPFGIKELVNIFRTTATTEFRTPIKVPELSDIMVQAKSAASNIEVSADFDIVLEENRT